MVKKATPKGAYPKGTRTSSRPRRVLKKTLTRGKKSSQKKVISHLVERSSQLLKTDKILVDNFVSLQKVMTNLAVKFDHLSTQLTKLLDLFEISAKALAEKDVHLDKERRDSKQILNKLENLEGQNKIIARGLSLMHDKIPHQEGFEEEQVPGQMQKPTVTGQMQKPTPQPMQRPAQSVQPQGPTDQYYKSISSQPKKLPRS